MADEKSTRRFLVEPSLGHPAGAMGRIQANTGLVTGIDIQGTVDKLMALQGRPKLLATERLTALKSRQTAVADLTAAVIAIQLASRQLGHASLFTQSTATSSNPSLLTVSTLSGTTATPGSYLVTPVRQAQAQQLMSQGFASTNSALGGGSVTLRKGGSLESPVALADLNGGAGIARGKIRITDRSGASEVIDLRLVHSVEDVLQTINSSETINVRAVTEGDRIRLIDGTGQTAGNLRVQEVSGGTTAASLGLAGIDAAANSAVGSDVLRLHAGLALNQLNDGIGLAMHSSLADLRVTLKDGSSVDIDFRRLPQPATFASATMNAGSGVDGDLKFTAKTVGGDYDGVAIAFIHSGNAAHGSETVAFDANAKTLTFDIAPGETTADDIIAALNGNGQVAALFSAEKASGGNGTGLIGLSDSATTSGGAAKPAGNETTLGDLLATINAAAPAKLKAEISSDGDRLLLTDLTGAGGNLTVQSLSGGSLAEQLGLAGSTGGNSLSGGRLLSGLNTTLLRSLGGGQRLGPLGVLSLTDRSGAAAQVDLASAETIDEVLSAINNAGLGLRAELNASRNGLRIVDTTGATNSNLIVANGDGTATATKLGLAVNAAQSETSGGSLHRQTLGANTTLTSLNNGAGVRLGSFTITDSSGASRAINLRLSDAKTLGDVIQLINDLPIGVQARINNTGDGLLLIDTAGGPGKLIVADATSGTAADLKILGQSVETTINGSPAKVIDGTTALKVELAAGDTLADLAAKINALSGGVNATIFSDGGSAAPHRLALTSSATGKANQWQVETGGLALSFAETATARDALVAVGPAGATGPSLLASSGTNVFDNAVPGVRITLAGASTDPVTITVKRDATTISGRVKAMVDSYNRMHERLEKYDFYQAETNTRGVLYAASETLRIKSDLSRLLTGRFTVDGKLQSLESIGVSFKTDGTLDFNATKFENAYNADPAAVEKLFTDTSAGFGKKVDEAVERLAGIGNSVLINRTIALNTQAEQLGQRIDRMTETLERSRERMLLQFYRLEESIGKIQNTYGAIMGTLQDAANLYNNLRY
jgi:flagellar hook-associated protein 2